MADDPRRTGNYPAVRPSPVPPPPAGTPARDEWVATEVRLARRESRAAIEIAERIEESVGYSPDAARGIKEGKGIAGQLSVLIEQNTRREQTAATRGKILLVVSIVLGIIGGSVGIVKTLGELLRR